MVPYHAHTTRDQDSMKKENKEDLDRKVPILCSFPLPLFPIVEKWVDLWRETINSDGEVERELGDGRPIVYTQETSRGVLWRTSSIRSKSNGERRPQKSGSSVGITYLTSDLSSLGRGKPHQMDWVSFTYEEWHGLSLFCLTKLRRRRETGRLREVKRKGTRLSRSLSSRLGARFVYK